MQNNTQSLVETHAQAVLPKLNKTKKCRIICTPNEDGKGFSASVLATQQLANGVSGEDFYGQELCVLTGTENKALAKDIVVSAAYNIVGHSNFGDKQNIILQSLAEQQPKDTHEARLCVQAAVLYSQGMDYLDRARDVFTNDGTFCKDHWHTIFLKSATRLLDLHNRTVSELARYKQNGKQQIVVQHIQLGDNAKAVVGGVVNGGGGGN